MVMLKWTLRVYRLASDHFHLPAFRAGKRDNKHSENWNSEAESMLSLEKDSLFILVTLRQKKPYLENYTAAASHV